MKVYLLLAFLAASVCGNGWFLYKAIDVGVGRTYREASFRSCAVENRQLRAITGAMVKSEITKESILGAAQIDSAFVPFEKEGYIWVRSIGMKFDKSERLIDVKAYGSSC